jgi:CRP-like cAMP-binding protein
MSDHLIDRILLFEKAEIFAGLNLDERAAIASLAKIERHHSGQAIYRQGDPSTTLYVLIKGGIDFHRDGSFVGRMESGTSQICFGDIGFLDRKPRPYSATACKSTEFTEIFAVNRQDFMDLVADRIELLDGLFSVLVGQLRTELETVESTRLNLAAVPDDV